MKLNIKSISLVAVLLGAFTTGATSLHPDSFLEDREILSISVVDHGTVSDVTVEFQPFCGDSKPKIKKRVRPFDSGAPLTGVKVVELRLLVKPNYDVRCVAIPQPSKLTFSAETSRPTQFVAAQKTPQPEPNIICDELSQDKTKPSVLVSDFHTSSFKFNRTDIGIAKTVHQDGMTVYHGYAQNMAFAGGGSATYDIYVSPGLNSTKVLMVESIQGWTQSERNSYVFSCKYKF